MIDKVKSKPNTVRCCYNANMIWQTKLGAHFMEGTVHASFTYRNGYCSTNPFKLTINIGWDDEKDLARLNPSSKSIMTHIILAYMHHYIPIWQWMLTQWGLNMQICVWFVIIAYSTLHDDVIKWKHFPRYWPFVRGIHRWPVDSPHKGQWRGVWMFSLICAWTNDWGNNRDTGDLRRHRAYYDVTVMSRSLHELASRELFRSDLNVLSGVSRYIGRDLFQSFICALFNFLICAQELISSFSSSECPWFFKLLPNGRELITRQTRLVWISKLVFRK